jgi:hypothetical protein
MQIFRNCLALQSAFAVELMVGQFEVAVNASLLEHVTLHDNIVLYYNFRFL